MDTQNHKSMVLKSIMNNPTLRRTMFSALKAPLGSTQRTKAQNVLSAFNKVALNKQRADGQGGPSISPTFSYNNITPTSNFDNNFSSLQVWPTFPQPVLNPGK